MKYVMLWALLFSTSSFGQVAVGNGGHGVACNGVATIDTLDLFELRQSGGSPDLGPAGTSVDAKIQIALDRLHRLDPNRADQYASEAATFWNDAQTPHAAPITEDQGRVVLPDTCQLVQIVAQFEPRYPGEIVYVIGTDNWNRTDDDSKATLILHEIIYRQAIEFGLEASTHVRDVVRSLISGDFDSLDREGYLRLARSAKLLGDAPIGPRVSAGKSFATDGDFIYYAEYDGPLYDLKRMNVRNGESTLITSVRRSVDELALSGSHLYFLSDRRISRIPKDGSGTIEDLPLRGTAFSLLNGSIYLATTTSSGTELWSYDLSTLAGQHILDLGSLTMIRLKTSNLGIVYEAQADWTAPVEVFSSRIDGSNFVGIGAFQSAQIALNDTQCYLSARSDTPMSSVYQLDPRSGSSELMFESEDRVGLAAQDGKVYFSVEYAGVYVREPGSTVDRFLGEGDSCQDEIIPWGENLYCRYAGYFSRFYKSIF